MKVSSFTLGCKVNQYETQAILDQFKNSGFDLCEPSSDTDIFIINSCTVTSVGDKKTRQVLHRFKKQNPHSIIVLTGCYPQSFPQEAVSLYDADIITGTHDRKKIIAHVLRFLTMRQKIVDILPHQKSDQIEDLSVMSFDGRTRAYVKIEDGCDNFCTYCIIPTARGFVRSKKPEDIKKEISSLVMKGYKEIVLVGINLCFYGRDLGLSFVDGIKAACSVEGVERIRLGSLEPEILTEKEILTLSEIKNLCPSFHLSLQSGCDKTLKNMARKYSTSQFRHVIENIKEHFPDATFTTDIMVGFPGESDEDFNESLVFVKSIGFLKVHVFSYSKRPGTKAASMENQISSDVKSKRSKEMISVCNDIRKNILQDYVNSEMTVLFESCIIGKTYEGYTHNYIPVRVECDEDLGGRFASVLITGSTNEWCTGIIVGMGVNNETDQIK